MRIGTKKNEYGTTVGHYLCEKCDNEYTVCPNPKQKDDSKWDKGCLSPNCASYNPARDFDKGCKNLKGHGRKNGHVFIWNKTRFGTEVIDEFRLKSEPEITRRIKVING